MGRRCDGDVQSPDGVCVEQLSDEGLAQRAPSTDYQHSTHATNWFIAFEGQQKRTASQLKTNEFQ